MQRPATWKILTISAAFVGLSVAGAGSALAATPDNAPQVMPALTAPAPAHVPFPQDDFFWDDDWDDFPVHRFWPGYHWNGYYDDDWYDDWDDDD